MLISRSLCFLFANKETGFGTAPDRFQALAATFLNELLFPDHQCALHKQHLFTPCSVLLLERWGSGGGTSGASHTSMLCHCSSPSLVFLILLRKMIPNRYHTKTMSDHFPLSDASPSLCLCSFFFLSKRSDAFLDTGSETNSVVFTRSQSTVRTLNPHFCSLAPLGTVPLFHKLQIPHKTFPGWVWSYIIMNITIYL